MSAIPNEHRSTSFLEMSLFGKVAFLCKLVVFILTMGYAFPRLLTD
ncbi:MAG TPA: hypothetical protein VNT02_13265 [Burkholderiales bacterium]|nr:hypothetical protein [Burkholderiales bacterium]